MNMNEEYNMEDALRKHMIRIVRNCENRLTLEFHIETMVKMKSHFNTIIEIIKEAEI